MIEISQLTKHFEKPVLKDLSFNASAGETIGLLGPNGAGKSTTMRILSGFLKATSGKVKIMGFDIEDQTLQAQKHIGYLPEGVPCYNNMSVWDFLEFIAKIRGLKKKQKREGIARVVAQLELGQVLHKPIQNLSKGLKRTVGIAQAIIHEPEVLILDEPTDGLDPNQKQRIHQLIQTLSQGRIIIISTHILDEVSSLCNRALVIADGQLLADSSPTALEERSRYHQAVRLQAEQPLDLLALAVLPGVAGIEEDKKTPGSITILAAPGETIFPHINTLITTQRWPVSNVSLVQGRLEEVFQRLTREPKE